MKLLALVLACALTLTTLVTGCQELGDTCGRNLYCCNEGPDTGQTTCIGTCIPNSNHAAKAKASTQLRGAVEAVEFITEDKSCRGVNQACVLHPCCDDLVCTTDPWVPEKGTCQPRPTWEHEDDLA